MLRKCSRFFSNRKENISRRICSYRSNLLFCTDIFSFLSLETFSVFIIHSEKNLSCKNTLKGEFPVLLVNRRTKTSFKKKKKYTPKPFQNKSVNVKVLRLENDLYIDYLVLTYIHIEIYIHV